MARPPLERATILKEMEMEMTAGQEALARVIRRIRANEGSIQGAEGAAIAAWPEFKAALAAALAELDAGSSKA